MIDSRGVFIAAVETDNQLRVSTRSPLTLQQCRIQAASSLLSFTAVCQMGRLLQIPQISKHLQIFATLPSDHAPIRSINPLITTTDITTTTVKIISSEIRMNVS